MINIQLRRNPLMSSSTYEHEFAPFEGNSNCSVVEEYLDWREFLIKYICYGPLNTPMQKFCGIEQLLASKALSQWGAIKNRLIAMEEIITEDQYKQALKELRKVYMEPMA